jgi:hypothetical protein
MTCAAIALGVNVLASLYYLSTEALKYRRAHEEPPSRTPDPDPVLPNIFFASLVVTVFIVVR